VPFTLEPRMETAWTLEVRCRETVSFCPFDSVSALCETVGGKGQRPSRFDTPSSGDERDALWSEAESEPELDEGELPNATPRMSREQRKQERLARQLADEYLMRQCKMLSSTWERATARQELTTLTDEVSVAAFRAQRQHVATSARVPSYARPCKLSGQSTPARPRSVASLGRRAHGDGGAGCARAPITNTAIPMARHREPRRVCDVAPEDDANSRAQAIVRMAARRASDAAVFARCASPAAVRSCRRPCTGPVATVATTASCARNSLEEAVMLKSAPPWAISAVRHAHNDFIAVPRPAGKRGLRARETEKAKSRTGGT